MNKPSPSRKSRQPNLNGFTIVELLIVVAIIAVLISMLLPALGKVREQANSARCAANVRQIYSGLIAYASDNQERLPIPPWIWDTNPSDPWGYPCTVFGVIDFNHGRLWKYFGGYDKAFDVFNCLTDLEDLRVVRWGNVYLQPRNFTYSFNAEMRSAPGQPDGTGIRMFNIINPGTKVIIVEEQWPNDGCAVIDGAGDPDDIFTNRHNGRGNQGFADGHVENLAPEDFGFATNGFIVNTTQNARTCNLFASF